DWSSDVCSSDLVDDAVLRRTHGVRDLPLPQAVLDQAAEVGHLLDAGPVAERHGRPLDDDEAGLLRDPLADAAAVEFEAVVSGAGAGDECVGGGAVADAGAGE